MPGFALIYPQLKKFFQQKIAKDLLWTYAALFVTLLTGIIVNILIISYYDTAVLGAFTINYSLYFIFIQLFGCGIQFSVLKYASEQQREEEHSVIILSASFVSFFFGAFGSLLLFFFLNNITDFFSSQLTGDILQFSLIGIWLYVVNKCILFSLNARLYMKAYAIGQFIRFIIFCLIVLYICINDYNPAYLGLSLSFAEVALSLYLIVCLLKYSSWSFSRGKFFSWIKNHLCFGARSFSGALFIDLHSRLDILMLGFFAPDSLVGVYSLAAMIAEGLIALLAVIRTNVTPLLTDPLLRKNYDVVREIFRTARFWAWITAAGISSLVLCLFFFSVPFFLSQQDSIRGFFSLVILLVGVCVYAGYLPVSLLFNQAGRPGVQTVYLGGCVLFNAVGNLCFIPLLGLYGAALGTALSCFVAIFFFSYLVRQTLGFSLTGR